MPSFLRSKTNIVINIRIIKNELKVQTAFNFNAGVIIKMDRNAVINLCLHHKF